VLAALTNATDKPLCEPPELGASDLRGMLADGTSMAAAVETPECIAGQHGWRLRSRPPMPNNFAVRIITEMPRPAVAGRH